MFTELLAPRVESLVAADISATALERARARCSAHPHVAFVQHDISVGMPGDAYDLVVCSEILYYLRDRAAVERFVGEIYRALRPGGYVLTTHATMVSDDRSVTGFDFNEIGAATIGEVFSQQPGLDFERELRTDLYRVQLFRRTEAAIPALVGREIAWSSARDASASKREIRGLVGQMGWVRRDGGRSKTTAGSRKTCPSSCITELPTTGPPHWPRTGSHAPTSNGSWRGCSGMDTTA